MSFLRDFAATLWSVVRAHWGQILIIQLLAGIGQTIVHSRAVQSGRTDAVMGLLLTGMGTLIAVAGLVAICVVCQDVLASTESLHADPKQRRRQIATTFTVSILPFFLLYRSWGLFEADIHRYARDALNSLDFSAGEGAAGAIVDVQASAVTIGIILVAFFGRIAVRRWLPDLGGLKTFLLIMLEAGWAFLAAMLVGQWLQSIVAYLGNLNLVVGTREALESSVSWAGGLSWLFETVGNGLYAIFTPLLWVTLAGITVVRGNRFTSTGLSERLGRYADRLPSVIDDLVSETLVDLRSRWVPVVGAFTVMARAGALALATAVALGTLTTFLGGWLTVALAHLPTPAAAPLTGLLGEALIGLGNQVTLALTITVALVSFDVLYRRARSVELTSQVHGEPARGVGPHL